MPDPTASADDATLATALKRYADYYTRLTPETLGDIDHLARADMRFTDPFNDLPDRAAYKRLLAQIFATIASPRFVVLHSASKASVGYLKWRFEGTLRGRAFSVVGVGEVQFDAQGMVVAHHDHWDAASNFYERIPILGWLLRRIKKRVPKY